MESELYLVNDATYLYICEVLEDFRHIREEFHYVLYDRETMRRIEIGQITIPDSAGSTQAERFAAARSEVYDASRITPVKIERVPLDIMDKLETAEVDTILDEYPMPDPHLTMGDIANSGYLQGDLLPVSFDSARELSQKGIPLCEVTSLGTLQDVTHELTRQQVYATLGVRREVWENSQLFRDAVAERMEHQPEREKAFLTHKGDCFAIYQLKHDDPEIQSIRYKSFGALQDRGLEPQRENYELVYTAPFTEKIYLQTLWDRFNAIHPADYQHSDISVSDVIAINLGGEIFCHYVDTLDYMELYDFIENPTQQREQNITISARRKQPESSPEIDNLRQQLTDRLTENFSSYKADLLLKDKQELIDGAKQIADTAAVYHHMMQRSYSAEELNYLLQFQSPLELVADYWSDAKVYPDALDSIIADIADKQEDLSLFPLVSEEHKPAKKEVAQHKEQETERTQKPSIKEQLAAKPVPGDKPATKSKNRGVR